MIEGREGKGVFLYIKASIMFFLPTESLQCFFGSQIVEKMLCIGLGSVSITAGIKLHCGLQSNLQIHVNIHNYFPSFLVSLLSPLKVRQSTQN